MGTKTLPILWLYTEKESIYPHNSTQLVFRDRTDTQLLKQDSPKILKGRKELDAKNLEPHDASIG